jgi:hypothetical protein
LAFNAAAPVFGWTEGEETMPAAALQSAVAKFGVRAERESSSARRRKRG